MPTKDTHIIDVKTKGAKKSQQQIKGVGNALGSMAKKAGAAAAAYFGTRALLQGIQSSIDLFAKQELAQKKLEAALGKTSPSLLKQARALQQVSMFGDEVIIEAQALIGSFVKEEDAIKKATKATLDLAAAKGMELTVAADLVSKTLGSSTNALSRYGIEVTGAVGSTERLESLTGNLAEVFGGQATAQSETLAGSMAQLSNALGDVGENIGEQLAPMVKGLADSFKELITVDPSAEAMKEKEEFEKLLSVLIDVNSAESSRNLAIEELQQNYPDYIENIDLEKTTTEELVDLKKQSLDLMNQEIIAMVQKEALIELERERFELEKELFELETERANLIAFNSGNVFDMGELQKEQIEARLEDIQTEINLVKELGKEQEKNTTKQIKNDETGGKIKGKIDKMILDNKGKIKDEIGKIEEVEKAKDIKEAFRTAFGIAGDAFRWGTEKGGPVLGAVMGALGLAAGLAYAKKITAAQYGADFVTDGPQLMMVGEGSGPERVQVTPLVDENINGPQGGNINLTINSPIMTEEFTEEVIIPQIKEGLRLGNDMGV